MRKFFHVPILFGTVFILLLSCEKPAKEQKNDFKEEIRRGYDLQIKAEEFLSEGKNDSAFRYFSSAHQYYEKASDSERIANVLFRIAHMHWIYNDYSEMETTTIEALKHLDAGLRPAYNAVIYNNFGLAYFGMEDYPRAIENYKKILKISDNPVHRLTALNNIAYTHMNAGDYKNAYSLLSEIHASPNINDSIYLKARVKDNLGFSAFKLGKPGYLELMHDGLRLRKEINDMFGQTESYLNLANAMVDSDRQAAIRHAKEAERVSAAIPSADDRLTALKFLSTYETGDEAKKFAADYFRISDSLKSARQKARNHFAEIRYNYKIERDEKLKSQENAAKLELQKAEVETTRLWWAIAAICTIFVSISIIYWMIRRHRRNRLKAAYDTEVRISKQLHDELANDLHHTIVFTETSDMSQLKQRNKLLESLDSLYKRARSISRENAAIDMKADFIGTLRELLSSYVTDSQAVLPVGIDGIPWGQLDEQKKVVVYRTVQELLVNMKKHSDCTKAVLRFEIIKGRVSITYSDNGKGASDGKTRNGLSIMENRISALKGTATFESNTGKGFRAVINFPL